MKHDSFAVTAPPLQTPVAPSPNATPPAAVKKTGLKKLTFGGITAKKAEDTKTAYPVLPDADGQIALIAARIKRRSEELDALEGALATDKAELKMRVAPFYFGTHAGKAGDIPSSISVTSDAGEVIVCFQNRYPKLEDEGVIAALIGDELTEKFFRQQAEVVIKCDQIPGDGAQEFVDELQQLAARYRAGDALTVKSSIKPVAEFHAARHRLLTLAQNVAVEQAFPIVAMIKTKGRGEK